MTNAMHDTLDRLARRMPRVVREHEVLRVSGYIKDAGAERAAQLAIDEVLKWIEERCGGQLPPAARQHQSFEFLSGGRNSRCVTLAENGTKFYALRADDPDKNVAERVWTTEVVIGHQANEPAKLSIRLLVSTPEDELRIEPAAPKFVREIVGTLPLFRGKYRLLPEPRLFDTPELGEELADALIDSQRELPFVVVTLPTGYSDIHPTVDVDALSRSLAGMCHVALLTDVASWALTDRFGRFRSVFGGAIRIYLPKFNEESDPFSHRLILADQLSDAVRARGWEHWIREIVAKESVRSSKLGNNILSFSSIRDASLALKQTALETSGASVGDQFEAAKQRIAALEEDINRLKSENEYYVDEYKAEQQRAIISERIAESARYQIQELRNLIRDRGGDPDTSISLPTQWEDIEEWCDKKLFGRLVLTPSARRGLKKSEYRDTESASTCLHWLATTYLQARKDGGDGPLRSAHICNGLYNERCGDDEYRFDWENRRLLADWHIKNHGNIRDPARCLRIYYAYDDQTQQVIVSDLPTHRRTGAS